MGIPIASEYLQTMPQFLKDFLFIIILSLDTGTTYVVNMFAQDFQFNGVAGYLLQEGGRIFVQLTTGYANFVVPWTSLQILILVVLIQFGILKWILDKSWDFVMRNLALAL